MKPATLMQSAEAEILATGGGGGLLPGGSVGVGFGLGVCGGCGVGVGGVVAGGVAVGAGVGAGVATGFGDAVGLGVPTGSVEAPSLGLSLGTVATSDGWTDSPAGVPVAPATPALNSGCWEGRATIPVVHGSWPLDAKRIGAMRRTAPSTRSATAAAARRRSSRTLRLRRAERRSHAKPSIRARSPSKTKPPMTAMTARMRTNCWIMIDWTCLHPRMAAQR